MRTGSPVPSVAAAAGALRISAVWQLPELLREYNVDLAEVLEVAGVPPETFADRENSISYAALERLFLACEQRLNCDHFGLLIGQRSRLADMGLAGQMALCAESVGAGLQSFVDYFNLHDSAATMGLVTTHRYAHFVYAIAETGMTDTRHFQLGAITIAFNILQDLCGSNWLPSVVTIAGRSPSNPRPCFRFFRAPVRFDSEESSLVFERHWLDRALPVVDAAFRDQVADEVRTQQAARSGDLPGIVRRLVRKQILLGSCSMDSVADVLGMNRRTLDRHLRQFDVHYGELLESVKDGVARQLLRETDLQVQQVAASLQFSSAANFATAFRRWSGLTPSEFRRQSN